MSWYYADWSWLRTLITSAAFLTSAVVIACAVANVIRSRLIVRHAEVAPTNRFGQPSLVETRDRLRHAPHHASTSQAA